jgi:hypothetical protein
MGCDTIDARESKKLVSVTKSRSSAHANDRETP